MSPDTASCRPARSFARGRWPQLLAVAIALAAVPLRAAAPPDPCQGRHVRTFAGPHAVSRQPLRDVADLQRRLPQLESAMREAIAADATLGPGVAEALFAAIRSGAGITQRKLARQEPMQWMVYQPAKGRFERVVQPCVNLGRDYDAFEITVEVAEPPPVAASDARCALAVTRNCEHQNPTLTLDLAGSSANARVESAGRPVPASGTRWAIADEAPCSQDATFVVRAQGTPPPAHTARVYRFVLPKVCSNLAYLGEAPRRMLAAAGPPATCEKTVMAPQCAPWAEVAVEPQTIEVHHPATIRAAAGWPDCSSTLEAICSNQPAPIALEAAAETTFTPGQTCCGEEGYEIRLETKNAAGQTAEATAMLAVEPHDWVVRPAIVYYSPRDGEQERDVALPFGASGRESYEVDDGYGLSLAAEKLLDERWGIEFAAILGRVETSYELTTAGETGEADHNANFYAFTVGPNLHLLRCQPADLYLGLFAGYAGLADPNYWVFDHHFNADLGGEFVWGAQLGLDVPFSATSDWGFHAAVRYFALEQETDAGTLDVDPLIVGAGLSYRF